MPPPEAGAPANYSNATPQPDGTLILDVVDMRTHKLVFRGTATGHPSLASLSRIRAGRPL